MPVVEWACYVAALPLLDAEQTLRDAEAAALPWASPRDRRRALSRLRRLSNHQDAAPRTPIDGMAVRHHPATPTNALD